MRDNREFDVIAYPHGERRTVATVYAKTPGEVVVGVATVQAAVREEYVDVFEHGRGCIATVGPDGECI